MILRLGRALPALALAAVTLAIPWGSRVAAADDHHIAIINAPSDAGAEVYYAQERGFFRKYGLDVTITNLASGAAVAAAMSSGQYDIAQGNIVTVAAAKEAGLPFVFIAPAALYLDTSPTTELVVLKDSPIKTAGDLVGKTVANLSLNDTGTAGLSAWLLKQHVDPTQVHVVEMPLSSMDAGLEHGTVSAAIMLEPFLSAGLAQDTRVLANTYTAIAPRFLLNGFYARADWVDTHRDIVRAFSKAIIEAGQWANANHADSAEILTRITSIPITPQQTRATYASTLTEALLQPMIDAAASTKMLKTPLAASALLPR